MDLKRASYSTQSRISNQTLFYLMKEDNFKELEKKDKNKILEIKRNLDNNFKLNLVLISSFYCLASYFFVKKIKPNLINRVIDFSIISGIAVIGSFYTSRRNIQLNTKEINNLKTKYSLMIKNTINITNHKENRDFNMMSIHLKYSYSQINFLFLLMVRLFF